jgi:Sulfatase
MSSKGGRAELSTRNNDMTLNRRRSCGSILLAAVSALGVVAPMQIAQAQAPSTQSKPNILFILVDNLGYGELGVYGGGATRGAPTPRIDRLASEGLRLTNMNMETSPRVDPAS